MSLGIQWVEIPAGIVHRGTPAEQTAAVAAAHAGLAVAVEPARFRKEAPRTTIEVSGFVISRTPVTWAQWKPFAADAGVAVSDRAIDDHPVDGVPWRQAADYCRWLAENLGRPASLPTELRWERAAGGDTPREYPWGDHWDKRCTNTVELGIGHTLPVGTLTRGAGPYGVPDLAGNVDEWTADLYRPYPDAPDDVPATDSWAVDPHITRGGGFQHARDLARRRPSRDPRTLTRGPQIGDTGETGAGYTRQQFPRYDEPANVLGTVSPNAAVRLRVR